MRYTFTRIVVSSGKLSGENFVYFASILGLPRLLVNFINSAEYAPLLRILDRQLFILASTRELPRGETSKHFKIVSVRVFILRTLRRQKVSDSSFQIFFFLRSKAKLRTQFDRAESDRNSISSSLPARLMCYKICLTTNHLARKGGQGGWGGEGKTRRHSIILQLPPINPFHRHLYVYRFSPRLITRHFVH